MDVRTSYHAAAVAVTSQPRGVRPQVEKTAPLRLRTAGTLYKSEPSHGFERSRGTTLMRGWTVRDSLELYNVNAWGAGFFTVNDRGHVEVRPRGDQGPGVDLLDLVQDLEQ